jgi:hypothetical protein
VSHYVASAAGTPVSSSIIAIEEQRTSGNLTGHGGQIVVVKREKIRQTVGRIRDAELALVERALRLWLGLEG